MQIKQVGSNIKKTASAANSKKDNLTTKIDSITHNSSDRASSNVQSSKFSGNGGYYKSVADRAAKAMNRKSLSPSFKRRYIEETWGTRDDWRRDKNSWKKKSI